MQYVSALTSMEILACAKTLMNLGDFILNEIGQMEKDNYCMIPLI
jgi:hypothetical protein